VVERRFQQIAMMDNTTGELVERRLEHGTGEAERFYAALANATGHRAVVAGGRAPDAVVDHGTNRRTHPAGIRLKI